MGYTPKNKLTTLHYSDKKVVGTKDIPNTIAKLSDNAVYASVINKELVANFEQAMVEVSTDLWKDPSVDFWERPTEISVLTEVFRKVLNASKIDTAIATDIPVKSSAKVLLDNSVVSDILSRVVEFKRQLSDIVTTTDDVYGEANIDDDQTAWVQKIVLEQLATAEVTRISLEKVFGDSSVASEIITKVFAKTVTETAILSEVVILTTLKQLVETSAITETFAKALDKLSNESTISSDLFTKLLDKAVLEETILSETLAKDLAIILIESDYFLEAYAQPDYEAGSFVASDQVAMDTTRPLASELFQTTDTVEMIEVIKSLIEVCNFSELLSRVLEKKLEDTVISTDDFYGEANADDDQTASFTKVATDLAVSSDALQTLVAFYRSLTDTSSISDTVSIGVNLVKSETTVNTDLVTFTNNFIRSFLDSTLLGDVIAITLSKVASDTTSTLDTLSNIVSFNRTFSETFVLPEVLVSVVEKVLLDTSSTIEIISKTASTTLQSENTTAIDSKVLSISKLLIEALSCSEYIWANKQNYFASNYVIPGYVGINYTL